MGAGALPNDHVFIPANLTARSTGVNTGCAKMVGSTACDLKVYFTTNYHFPAHPNGRIKITIPSDITLTSTSCTATVGGVLATCSGSSFTEFTVTHDQTSSVANKAVVVTFNDFTQPLSMKPTSSITALTQEIETDMYDSGLTSTFFSIDGTTKELTYVSDQPNLIISPNVV